jgi:hypothetical protein
MGTDSCAGDRNLLIGCKAICAFVNSLVDSDPPITPKIIYGWIERKHLPVRRIGARVVGNKTVIREHLCGHSVGRSG